jgi:hypothetical protein
MAFNPKTKQEVITSDSTELSKTSSDGITRRRKKQREVGKCITLWIMKKRTWIVITLNDLLQFASYQ